ncbi:MAG: OsmC family protein [Magnetococcales bacterium]|nr:OsmC family protein [Magnetococcales bacterium]
MTARVKLIEGIQMLGESGSRHTVVMDGAESVGGRDMGIRPMELFLIGLGGCTSIDVLQILRKGRHDVQDLDVAIRGVRAEEDPKVFLTIKVHFKILGRNIPTQAVERAIRLSEEKYCSASIMLGKTATIETSYEIVNTDAAAAP